MKIHKRKKGFTLIELIIVIAIIAILAAIAIPKYNKSRQKAAISAHNANVQMLKTAANAAVLDGEDPNWSSETDASDYVDKWPEIPKGLDTDSNGYTVEYSQGVITVTPGEIEE